MCCHHRRPREANQFHLLSWSSLEAELFNFNANIFVENNFLEEFNKNKEFAITDES
jgi:hypothetical protein